MSPIKPYHVGEPLVAELFRRVLKSRAKITCKTASYADKRVLVGEATVDLLEELAICGPDLRFVEEVRLPSVIINGEPRDVDGSSKIDVLAYGSSASVAVEVKLGDTKVLAGALGPPRRSAHKKGADRIEDAPKINGQVPGILNAYCSAKIGETELPLLDPRDQLEAWDHWCAFSTRPIAPLLADGKELPTLRRDFWIVVLRKAWVTTFQKQIQKRSGVFKHLRSRVLLVSFDDLVEKIGPTDSLDQVMSGLIGTGGWYREWKIGATEVG